MKVLFIIAESTMCEHMSIMCLSAALKEKNYEVQLVLASELGQRGLDNFINNYKPQIIGYSAMTGEHLKLLAINRTLKSKFNFLSVFGGPHATFFPQLIEEDGCDAICIGEGDKAFPEFCRRLEQQDQYWKTPNFIVKYKEQVYHNPLLPLIENLDELPFPDREIMYQADPRLKNIGHKMFFASRGCPYLCTYCFNRKYNDIYQGKGEIVRHWSPENVVDQISQVKERYPINMVWINDNIFILKPKGWFERFAELYKERVNLPMSCNVRANLVNDKIIRFLKEAGLDSVGMAIECGDENVANGVLERNLTNQQILKAADIIKRHGVKLLTQNMVGLPVPDSYNIDLKTLDINIKIAPTYGFASILYPYPGTKIEKYSHEHGYLSKDAPVLETNKRSSILTFSSSMEKRKIENLHKLFALIVKFPFLRKFCNFLCSLPITGFYNLLYYLWYGYYTKFIFLPIYSLRKEIWGYICLWFRMIRKT